MLTAVAAGGCTGLDAAIYYLVHSTLVVAVLFVLCDLLGRQRGAAGDAFSAGPTVQRAAVLGLAFLFAGATVAGLPPSTGFLGKVMILRSVMDTAHAPLIWTVILVTSLAMVVGCARAGSALLWKTAEGPAATPGAAPRPGEWSALALLAVASALLIVYAAPAIEYAQATADQLAAPGGYVEAVLGRDRSGLLTPLSGGPR